MNHWVQKQPNRQLPFDLQRLCAVREESDNSNMKERQVKTRHQSKIDQFIRFETARNVAPIMSRHICRLDTCTQNNRNSDSDDRIKRNEDGVGNIAYM